MVKGLTESYLLPCGISTVVIMFGTVEAEMDMLALLHSVV